MKKDFENYLDKDKLKNDAKEYLEKAKKIEDIFIITKGGLEPRYDVLKVFDNFTDVEKYLNKKQISEMNQYYLLEYVSFLEDFIKSTNKYRTFKNKRIWKYNRTLELGRKPDLIDIKEIKKHEKVQFFFREKKLERIIK